MDKRTTPQVHVNGETNTSFKQIFAVSAILILFLVLLTATIIYTKEILENSKYENIIKETNNKNAMDEPFKFHHSHTARPTPSNSRSTLPTRSPSPSLTPSLSHSSSISSPISPSISPSFPPSISSSISSSISPPISSSISTSISSSISTSISPSISSSSISPSISPQIPSSISPSISASRQRIFPSPLPSVSKLPQLADIDEFCFRLATYNIFEGAKNGKKDLIAKYIIEKKIDVIALQELNGWTNDSLSKFGESVGHNFTAMVKTSSGYHMGFSSRFPFQVIQTRTKGFHHGIVHINMFQFLNESRDWRFNDNNDDDNDDLHNVDLDDIIADSDDLSLHMIVTHLSPKTEEDRLKEAHHIAIQSKEHRNFILFGDLNSLSPLDQDYYDRSNLYKTLRESELRVQNKFLNDDKSAIRYDVMKFFYNDGGLIDVNEKFRDEFEYTVPTPINNDTNHAAFMRLDYILTSPFLLPYFDSCYVDNNDDTSSYSDHYPVIADICYR